MTMQLVTGQAARRVSLASLSAMVQAIGASFGPDKRACLYSSGGAVDHLRNGKDIARFVVPGAGMMSIMPRILSEHLYSADRELGDGTSRLAILTYAMFKEAALLIDAGADSRQVAETLEQTVEIFCKEIERNTETNLSLEAVAITAGADTRMAEALANVAEKVGCDGTIEVTSGDDRGIAAHLQNGFVAEATPVLRDMQATALSSVHVLVANEVIDDFGSLAPVLEAFALHGKALLIFARDVTGVALQTLVANKSVKNLRVAAFRTVDVAFEAAEVLRDTAVATKAQLICSQEGTCLSELRPSMLGWASEFRCVDGRLLLSKPAGDLDAIANRSRMLLAEADRKRFLSLDRERLTRRAARLSGRFGELRIGDEGTTDGAAAQAVARRATASVLSALKGGTIAGGTTGLARLAHGLARSETGTAARRCLLAGIQALDNQIAFNRSGRMTGIGDPARAVADLAIREIDKKVQDPRLLTSQIFSRASSAAASFIQSDALLCRR